MTQEDAKEIVESDDESIATEDIVEEQLVPEHVPEPEPEPTPPKPRRVRKAKDPKVPHLELPQEPLIEPEPVVKKRGRKPGQKTTEDKSSITLYSKDELLELVKTQHELLKRHELIEVEKREFLKSRLENKPKVKRERTAAQIAATERMKAANAARRQAKLDSIANDVKGDLEKSVSDLVQDEVVKIIQAPMRTLTPERQRKVKVVEEVALSKYKSSF
jgi:hypothetical protein